MTIIYRVANGDLERSPTTLPKFWRNNLCWCERFTVTPEQIKQYDWWKDRLINVAPNPIGCGRCGKWPRSSIRECNECGVIFYKQYRSMLMPLRWDLDYCWGCMHAYGIFTPWDQHPWFENYQDARPPDIVIPPSLSKEELDDLFKL